MRSVTLATGAFAMVNQTLIHRSWVLILLVAASIGCQSLIRSEMQADARSFESASFRFRYPASWMVETSDQTYDPDHAVSVVDRRTDSLVLLWLYPSTLSIEGELADSLEVLAQEFSTFAVEQPFTEYGGLTGAGVSFRASIKQAQYRGRLFVYAAADDHILEIRELWFDMLWYDDLILPAIEMIRDSFELAPHLRRSPEDGPKTDA